MVIISSPFGVPKRRARLESAHSPLPRHPVCRALTPRWIPTSPHRRDPLRAHVLWRAGPGVADQGARGGAGGGDCTAPQNGEGGPGSRFCPRTLPSSACGRTAGHPALPLGRVCSLGHPPPPSGAGGSGAPSGGQHAGLGPAAQWLWGDRVPVSSHSDARHLPGMAWPSPLCVWGGGTGTQGWGRGPPRSLAHLAGTWAPCSRPRSGTAR